MLMATGPRYDEVRPALHINVDVPTTSKKHFLDMSSLSANLPKVGSSPQRFRRYDDIHRILSALKRGVNPTIQFNDMLRKVIVLQETLEIIFCKLPFKACKTEYVYTLLYVDEQIMNDILIESSFYSRYLQVKYF